MARGAWMTDVDALVAFIEARLGESERWAREAIPGPWRAHGGNGWGVVGERFGTHLPAGVADGVLYGDMHEPMSEADAEHIAAHDPQWALDDITAKRGILGRHCTMSGPGSACNACEGERWPCETVLWLAWPYRHHPDWRQEWTPEGASVDE